VCVDQAVQIASEPRHAIDAAKVRDEHPARLQADDAIDRCMQRRRIELHVAGRRNNRATAAHRELAAEPFLRNRWAGDIAAQPFEHFALMCINAHRGVQSNHPAAKPGAFFRM